MKRLTAAGLALALVASAAACGGADTSPLDLTPSGTLVTDTFTGVVPVAGVDSHNFSITSGGNSISVTLVSAGPPATITMGLGVGTPSSTGACSILTNGAIQTPASTTAQLSGTGFAAGTYCVVVGDIGNALQPITYTVTVAHT